MDDLQNDIRLLIYANELILLNLKYKITLEEYKKINLVFMKSYKSWVENGEFNIKEDFEEVFHP